MDFLPLRTRGDDSVDANHADLDDVDMDKTLDEAPSVVFKSLAFSSRMAAYPRRGEDDSRCRDVSGDDGIQGNMGVRAVVVVVVAAAAAAVVVVVLLLLSGLEVDCIVVVVVDKVVRERNSWCLGC